MVYSPSRQVSNAADRKIYGSITVAKALAIATKQMAAVACFVAIGTRVERVDLNALRRSRSDPSALRSTRSTLTASLL
jgi:hypothetical protein